MKRPMASPLRSGILDLLYPYAGPCVICGASDKRHRLADSIIDYARGGESVRRLSADYKVSEEVIRALVAYAAEQQRKHKTRWPT